MAGHVLVHLPRQDGADVALGGLGAGLLLHSALQSGNRVFGAQGEQAVVKAARHFGGWQVGNLAAPHQLGARRWAARTWLKMVESFSQSPRTSIHGARARAFSRLESSWCVWGEISSGGELADHSSRQRAQQVACVYQQGGTCCA